MSGHVGRFGQATILLLVAIGVLALSGVVAPTLPANQSSASQVQAGEVHVEGSCDGYDGDGKPQGVEDTDNDDVYGTIQAAHDAARTGWTVLVHDCTYTESVTVRTPGLTIRAAPEATITAGIEEAFRVTAAAPGVTIDGFDVRTTNGEGIWVGADRVVLEDNTVESNSPEGDVQRDDDGIRIVSSNGSIIRNNTVVGFQDDGISLGEFTGQGPRQRNAANESHHTLIANNNVTGTYASRAGIWAGIRATHIDIRNNTVIDNRPAADQVGEAQRDGSGIRVLANHSDVVGNTLRRNFYGIVVVFVHAEVRQNLVTEQLAVGIFPQQNASARIVGNTIRNNALRGIDIYRVHRPTYVLENEIINNKGDGLGILRSDPTKVEAHRNVILNNTELGIDNTNDDKSDGEWPIVNATNNVWNCGGPSTGLEDPYTGRVANGTGDEITAGDEEGVSNVHFDPFRVLSSCSSQPPSTGTPTDTPTATPEITPTATPRTTTETGGTTPTASPTGGGGGVGPGGDAGVSNTDEGESDTIDRTAEDTVTPSTPTSVPSPTSTIDSTPSPKVEPGFGIVTWVVGVAIVVGLFAVRRRSGWGGGKRNV